MTIILIILIFIFGFFIGFKFRNRIISFIMKLKKEKEESINEVEHTEDAEEEIEEFEDLKMVFLVRDDLKLGAGKISAQVAHAAVGLVEIINKKKKDNYYQKALNYWSEFGAKKIVLRVKDLEELKIVNKQCRKLKIPVIMISDAGHTQVDPGTITVVGIGPEESEKLNKLTGHFKLMR